MQGRRSVSHDRNHQGSDIDGVTEGESVEKGLFETGEESDDGGWKEQEGCMKWETEPLELAKYLMCELGYEGQSSLLDGETRQVVPGLR